MDRISGSRLRARPGPGLRRPVQGDGAPAGDRRPDHRHLRSRSSARSGRTSRSAATPGPPGTTRSSTRKRAPTTRSRSCWSASGRRPSSWPRTSATAVLHTFFADDTPALASPPSARRRRGGQGRTTPVRVWSVLATVGDNHLPGRAPAQDRGSDGHLPAGLRRHPRPGERLGPPSSARSARPTSSRRPGARSTPATTEELGQIAELIPDEWLAASATPKAPSSAAVVAAQFDPGADSVVLHWRPCRPRAVVDALPGDPLPVSTSAAPAAPGWFTS